MSDEQDYRHLRDRFLLDDLEDAEVERFYELVDDETHPQRREELDQLLLVSAGVDHALGNADGANVVDLGARRRWVLRKGSTLGLLAAAAAIVLAAVLWRSVSGPDRGEPQLPGIPVGGIKGSGGAEGPPLEVKLYLAVRSPDGSESRGTLDETYPGDHAVAPMVWCSRGCRVVLFLGGADEHRPWLDDDGHGEVLELDGGSVVRASWTGIEDRDGVQTITALAWGTDEELPASPEDWLGEGPPDAAAGSGPSRASWTFSVVPDGGSDPKPE